VRQEHNRTVGLILAVVIVTVIQGRMITRASSQVADFSINIILSACETISSLRFFVSTWTGQWHRTKTFNRTFRQLASIFLGDPGSHEKDKWRYQS